MEKYFCFDMGVSFFDNRDVKWLGRLHVLHGGSRLPECDGAIMGDDVSTKNAIAQVSEADVWAGWPSRIAGGGSQCGLLILRDGSSSLLRMRKFVL
jgi:hypothetical protein